MSNPTRPAPDIAALPHGFRYEWFRAWLTCPADKRKPAALAFTAGVERDAATTVEDAGLLDAAEQSEAAPAAKNRGTGGEGQG